jgi:YegS/Rv2252/BmrU family lipid kinase
MTPSADSPPGTDRRILVHNPASGDADHDEQIRRLAAERRFEVRETESAEDIVEKAAAAAQEAEVVAAAGGDGTLTRAVRGLDQADAFDDTLFGVVPVGTGNNFAGNVGVNGIEHGFDVIDFGDRRRIDVGLVNDTPFLNSVVAGLTAEASADTAPEAKERWGTLAYAMTTAETLREFDNLHLTIDPDDEERIECDAKIVFVGNARGFPSTGRSQGNVEDGLLDVVVIEDTSTFDLIEESLQRALGDEPEHVSSFQTRRLDIELTDSPDDISVDGEILTESRLSLAVRPETLWLAVGESYEPDPNAASDEG